MTIRIILILTLNITVFSCTSSVKEAPKTVEVNDAMNLIYDESTSSELYSRYYPNPQTQSQEEENLILDYIGEHNLAMDFSPEGVYYQITKHGKGSAIKWGEKLSVHYKGYRLDGTEFDNSYKRGKPISFRLGEMIDGWNHTLKRMHRGDHALLIIPSRLAYGNEGRGALVGSNQILAFEIKITE